MRKKSKRTRTLFLLLLFLLLCIGAWFLLDKTLPEGEEGTATETTSTDIYVMDYPDVREISWEIDNWSDNKENESGDYWTGDTAAATEENGEKVKVRFSYSKKEGEWVDDYHPDFPVGEEYFKTFLEKYTRLKAVSVFQDTGTEEMGFDHPYAVMDIKGNIAMKVTFGNLNATGWQRYVSVGDGNVYMVNIEDLIPLRLDRMTICRREALPDTEQLDRVRIFDAEENLLLSVKREGKTYYRMDTYAELSTELCEEYFKKVQALYWTEVLSYQAAKANLPSFGFNDHSTIVEMSYQDRETGEDTVLRILVSDAFTDSDYRNGKYENSKYVYRIPGSWFQDCNIAYDDLTDPEQGVKITTAANGKD